MAKMLLSLLFLLPLAHSSCSELSTSGRSLEKLSGEGQPVQLPAVLHVNRRLSPDNCEHTYGVMPCTSSVAGNAFLIVVYGYCIFRATKVLSDESEILLEILHRNLVGRLFLPVFSSIPYAIIILASGLPQRKETAQKVIHVGMGLLAGTAVALPTILWGSCVIVSSHGPDNSRRFSLTGTAVMTGLESSYAARIMVLSVIPIIVVLLLQGFKTTSQNRLAILISLIISVSSLAFYGLYQILWPWIPEGKLDYANQKHALSRISNRSKTNAVGRQSKENDEPDIDDAIKKSFKMIDKDNDGFISGQELKSLLLGMHFVGIDFDIDDAVESILTEFDTSGDSRVSMVEFVEKIKQWLDESKPSDGRDNHQSQQKVPNRRHHKQNHQLNGEQSDHVGEGSGNHRSIHHQPQPIRFKYTKQSDHVGESSGNHRSIHRRPLPIRFKYTFPRALGIVQDIRDPKWVACKAVLMLLLGTVLAAVFAAPMVDAVDDFATATSIPSFFVSFVALPLISFTDIVPALLLASQKDLNAATLTFWEIYRVVTVSNILGLSVFLSLIYIRHLSWEFSTEMLIIAIVCTAMGLLAGFRTTFHPWMTIVAFALYAFSLALVYVLHYVLGLS